MTSKTNPIPPLIMPAPNLAETRQGDNNNAVLRWSKGVSPIMFGVGDPIVGSNPPVPPSNAYLGQRGRQLVAFTAGIGTLTFPKAFPNGLLSAMLGGTFVVEYNPTGATLGSLPVTTSGIGTGSAEVDFDLCGW